MNFNDFRNNSHSYLDSLLDIHLSNKEIMNNMLAVFNDICTKYGINYCIGAGTLLGAIRDGESIPWDFDYDVWIDIKDAQKLFNYLKSGLPDNYYIDSNFNNNNYPLLETTIKTKEDKSGITHLDIFYLIGTPNVDDYSKVKKYSDYIRKFCEDYKGFHTFVGSQNKLAFPIKQLRRIKYFLKYCPLSRFIKDNNFKKRITKYPCDKSKYVIVLWGEANIIPKPLIGYETASLGNNRYPIPANFEDVLCWFYDDWKSYIPIENAFDDFYRLSRIYLKHNGFLRYFDYRYYGERERENVSCKKKREMNT